MLCALRYPAGREAHAQCLLGFLIWLATIALVQPGWSPALLAFGPLVLYPLLLEMLGETGLRRFTLVAFLPVLASYGLEQGTVAGVLALPWLVFTLVLWGTYAVRGAARRNSVVLLIKSYLIVGAGWLVLARLGERPLDYPHAIVHATAVHFHYAGFVLPIVALQWVRTAPSRGRNALLAALLLGVPLVATGITLSAFGIRWPELIAVGFFVTACFVYAAAQLDFALAAPRIPWLLVASSLALIAAMTLAMLYAVGNFFDLDWLDIRLMLRSHGPIQVFGFALPGVLGWTMACTDSNPTSLAVSRQSPALTKNPCAKPQAT